MTCGEIPVVQNMAYSTHTVRRALTEHAAKAGDYEIVDVLPYHPHSEYAAKAGDYEIVDVLPVYHPHSEYAAKAEDYEIVDVLPYHPHSSAHPTFL